MCVTPIGEREFGNIGCWGEFQEVWELLFGNLSSYMKLYLPKELKHKKIYNIKHLNV